MNTTYGQTGQLNYPDFPAAIKRMFEEKGLEHTLKEEDPLTYRMRYKGRDGEWSYYLRFKNDKQLLSCHSVFPVDTPPERRPAMMEFVTRLNLRMDLGTFLVDLEDGEIVLRTSFLVKDIYASIQMIENCLIPNLQLMDNCLRPMMLFLYEKCSMEDAFYLID